jgi:hypothetical protein
VYANENPAPKLLVIGGNSSLAPQLFELAEADGFDIYATYRGLEVFSNRSDVHWLYLDFSKRESIDLFFSQIEDLNFVRIVFLVGKTSGFKQKIYSEDDLESYFRTQLIRPIKVIDRLVSFLESEKPANFIFVSSRAALYGSYDWPYGVAKAGIQNFVTSTSKLIENPKSVLSVASGLIVGSTMQMEMIDEVFDSHKNRAHQNGFELMTIEHFVLQLWKFDPVATLEMNGDVVEIGAVY